MHLSEATLLTLAALVGGAEILLPLLDAAAGNPGTEPEGWSDMTRVALWVSHAASAGPLLRLVLVPLIAVHCSRDGLRWQLYPLYAALCVPAPYLVIIACIFWSFPFCNRYSNKTTDDFPVVSFSFYFKPP